VHLKVPAGFGGRLRGKGPHQRDLAAQPILLGLVLDQDGAQMCLTEDQHAVEELAAQGTEEAFAGCVHPGSLDSGLQDPGAVCLEDGVEGLGEV